VHPCATLPRSVSPIFHSLPSRLAGDKRLPSLRFIDLFARELMTVLKGARRGNSDNIIYSSRPHRSDTADNLSRLVGSPATECA